MMKAATRLAAASAICASVVAGADAGDGNRATVLQISPPGSTQGNVLVLDQSAASNSILTGVPLTGTLAGTLSGTFMPSNQLYGMAATQAGEGNSAHITLTGDGATAQLLQTTDNGEGAASLGGGNRATMLVSSAAVAGLVQIGSGNEASLSVNPHASAWVSQIGNGNLVSDLSVGSGGEAVVSQTGDHNTTGAIIVPSGVTLNYSQTGNGLSPANGNGVQVIYSGAPGAITISQQGW